MRKIILFLVCLVLVNTLWSQSKCEVHFEIKDSSSNEPILFAHVKAFKDSIEIGKVMSDTNGKCSLLKVFKNGNNCTRLPFSK